MVALVERGGEARSFYVEGTKPEDVAAIVRANVSKESRMHTDEHRMYWGVGKEFAIHERVNHGKKEYARGDVTTNTVESFFSVFRRGMRGVYQQCDEKHLHRYNARQSLGVNDQQRTSRGHGRQGQVRTHCGRSTAQTGTGN